MPVSITNLETSSNNGNSGATAVDTGNLSPASQIPMLVAISSLIGSGTPNTPTASLSGWTFNQVATVNFSTTGRLTLFTAIGSGNGQILFDFGGQGQTIFGWSVVQVRNGNKKGTGAANLVVQSASTSTPGTSYSITLGAFSSVNNGVFSVVAKNDTNNVSPNSGYTELGENSVSSPNWDIESMWRPDNNTTPGATFIGSGGANLGAIAVEVAFQAPGGLIGDI